MSPREKALELALEEFIKVVPEPPARNCSCHIFPPCHDCVENEGLRQAFDQAREALAILDLELPTDLEKAAGRLLNAWESKSPESWQPEGHHDLLEDVRKALWPAALAMAHAEEPQNLHLEKPGVTYGATIRWSDSYGRNEVTVSKCSSREEAWRETEACARRSGWTPPRWWQWWRWSDTRIPKLKKGDQP